MGGASLLRPADGPWCCLQAGGSWRAAGSLGALPACVPTPPPRTLSRNGAARPTEVMVPLGLQQIVLLRLPVTGLQGLSIGLAGWRKRGMAGRVEGQPSWSSARLAGRGRRQQAGTGPPTGFHSSQLNCASLGAGLEAPALLYRCLSNWRPAERRAFSKAALLRIHHRLHISTKPTVLQQPAACSKRRLAAGRATLNTAQPCPPALVRARRHVCARR